MSRRVAIYIPPKTAKKIEKGKIELSQAISFFFEKHDPDLLGLDVSPKTPQRRV